MGEDPDDFLVEMFHFERLLWTKLFILGMIFPYIRIEPDFTFQWVGNKDHIDVGLEIPKLLVEPFETDQRLLQDI